LLTRGFHKENRFKFWIKFELLKNKDLDFILIFFDLILYLAA